MVVPLKVWVPVFEVKVVALLVKLPAKEYAAIPVSFQTAPALRVTSPVNVLALVPPSVKVPVTDVVPVTPIVKLEPVVNVVPVPILRLPPTVNPTTVVAVAVPLKVKSPPIEVIEALSVFGPLPESFKFS